jgi:hypothetical protein
VGLSFLRVYTSKKSGSSDRGLCFKSRILTSAGVGQGPPSGWTKSADVILRKVGRARATLTAVKKGNQALVSVHCDGAHALVVPCRRLLCGWIDAATKRPVQVSPSHWQEWDHDR